MIWGLLVVPHCPFSFSPVSNKTPKFRLSTWFKPQPETHISHSLSKLVIASHDSYNYHGDLGRES